MGVPMPSPPAPTCRQCGRALHTADSRNTGLCLVCRRQRSAPTPPPPPEPDEPDAP